MLHCHHRLLHLNVSTDILWNYIGFVEEIIYIQDEFKKCVFRYQNKLKKTLNESVCWSRTTSTSCWPNERQRHDCCRPDYPCRSLSLPLAYLQPGSWHLVPPWLSSLPTHYLCKYLFSYQHVQHRRPIFFHIGHVLQYLLFHKFMLNFSLTFKNKVPLGAQCKLFVVAVP